MHLDHVLDLSLFPLGQPCLEALFDLLQEPLLVQGSNNLYEYSQYGMSFTYTEEIFSLWWYTLLMVIKVLHDFGKG